MNQVYQNFNQIQDQAVEELKSKSAQDGTTFQSERLNDYIGPHLEYIENFMNHLCIDDHKQLMNNRGYPKHKLISLH